MTKLSYPVAEKRLLRGKNLGQVSMIGIDQGRHVSSAHLKFNPFSKIE